jgi:hypothetical protein
MHNENYFKKQVNNTLSEVTGDGAGGAAAQGVAGGATSGGVGIVALGAGGAEALGAGGAEALAFGGVEALPVGGAEALAVGVAPRTEVTAAKAGSLDAPPTPEPDACEVPATPLWLWTIWRSLFNNSSCLRRCSSDSSSRFSTSLIRSLSSTLFLLGRGVLKNCVCVTPPPFL